MSEHDAICRVQEAVVPQLLAQPGVTGVGVGLRERGGQPTDEIVIRVYVARKRPASEVPAAELIPSEIGGFATDVIEKGPDEHCGFADYRQRPIGSGLAIERYKSNLEVDQGTIGCFVARRLTETERNGLRTQPRSSIIRRVFLLSASHPEPAGRPRSGRPSAARDRPRRRNGSESRRLCGRGGCGPSAAG